MLRSKLVLALLLAAPAAALAQGEEARPDTASQHHEWARKFAPAVLERSRSTFPGSTGARVEVPGSRCGTTGVMFSEKPLAQWRADLCG